MNSLGGGTPSLDCFDYPFNIQEGGHSALASCPTIQTISSGNTTMIVTDLEHLAEQISVNPALQKALVFLARVRSQALVDGRVEIDGGRVYALVQSYDTKDGEPTFEAHRQYLDIHYLASGEEIIGWAGIDRMVVDTPYDESQDVCLGRVPESNVTPVRLSPGQLTVLYPSDAHAPRMAAGAPAPVKKIVVKVAV